MATATLRRSLTLRDLIVYGLLFIGPLAPVGVFGVLDARTHGAVALIYLLATVAMAFTAWSYAEMSRVVPHAGSVFAYATEGLGHLPGFLAGWLAMLDYLLIPSVAYLFCGLSVHALMPQVPAWIFTVIAFGVTTLMNMTGVQVAARIGTLVVAIEILVLGAFVALSIYVLATTGPARPWLSPITGLYPNELDAVVGAISVAVLSYLGFDAIASFAEETTGSRDAIGRAILVCLAVAGVLFVVQAWLAALVSPLDPRDLAAHPDRQGTAFYLLTREALAPWLSTVLSITKAIGPAFAAMTAQAAASRLLFGMARDGRLPKVLASVDKEHGVPRTALLTAAALTLVVSVWAAVRPDGLDVLVSIVDVGALAAFTLLHASVVGYFAWRKRAPFRMMHYAIPVLGAAVTLWIIIESQPLAHVVGGAWLAAGIAVFLVQPAPAARS